MSNKITIAEAVRITSRAVEKLLQSQSHVTVSIDGRCGSGKTTFAEALGEKLDCKVIHMDDFFLRPEQRTAERLSLPGENIDHERFLSEVLMPLSLGERFEYLPYDCQSSGFKKPVNVIPGKITIIEGSYACHPTLIKYYDICIFADTDAETQFSRIKKRNGDSAAERFRNIWIPLEEKYFSSFDIKNLCSLKFTF